MWHDKDGNERILVIIPMTTAMRAEDLLRTTIRDADLVIDLKLPNDMFSAQRILAHSRFVQDHYSDIHPKMIALKLAAGEIMDKSAYYQTAVKIRLPSSGFEFTDEEISGHKRITIYHHEEFHDNGRVNQMRTSIFCIIDLMRKNTNRSQFLSKRPELKDDFELD